MCAARRPSVGLDFGTSTTLVASTRGVVPISNNQGAFPWMPSLVGCADDGSVVAGEKAQELPDRQLVRSIKRWITEDRTFVRMDVATGVKDVRVDDLIVELLREVGPMAVSSANRSGLPPATTVEQARQQLADRVGVFLDGGPAGQLASTIVDLTADDPVVLREGAVTAAAIGEVLGQAIHVAP